MAPEVIFMERVNLTADSELEACSSLPWRGSPVDLS